MRYCWRQLVLCLAASSLLTGCASPFMAGDRQSKWSQFENNHVFVPAKYPEGDWKPAAYQFEDVWFKSDDGTRLNGWYYPQPKPAAVVLLAHGNAGNVTHTVPLLKRLHDDHNLTVFSFDYRGYGKSDGTPDEAGVLADTRAARKWLAQRAHVAEHDILLVGHSLGSGAMVELAATDGARGLILLNAFTSLPEVAGHHWPLVPTGLLMQNRLDSLARIDRYQGPLLQVHGDRDRVVPLSQGQRLFEKAHEPKQFVLHAGGRHQDPPPPEFDEALDKFLAQLAPAETLPEPRRWRAVGSTE
ncbi:MAG: alpha/beta hydrolase [Planctomycetes bacterium]|nr:alpha/beta hydrolase [Planctomycetota bacterium]